MGRAGRAACGCRGACVRAWATAPCQASHHSGHSTTCGGPHLSGKLRLPARSTTECSVRLFCTMNCARSPTTLLLGVTWAGMHASAAAPPMMRMGQEPAYIVPGGVPSPGQLNWGLGWLCYKHHRQLGLAAASFHADAPLQNAPTLTMSPRTRLAAA